MMKFIVIIASVLAAVTLAEFPRGWVSLFAPPFEGCPSIMMALSCVSNSSCFIAGAENVPDGQAFGVMNFDGQMNGNFTALNMPTMDMMIMAMGVGGTTENPRGAVGGLGFGHSVQYFVNATTLEPSSQPFFVMTQDIRASKDGKNIIVIDQGGSNSVLFSTNYGQNFTNFPITSLMPSNETFARYGAIADPDTWYVTLGNWPENAKRSDDEIHLGPKMKMTRDPKTKRWKKSLKPRSVTNPDVESFNYTGYSCVIAKTTDAGKTWHNVMYETKWYYPNGIDCHSATHCVAVGDGEDLKAGGHIWTTFDGLSFQETLHMKDNATGQWSMMSVKFNGPNDIWVGGSFDMPGTAKGVFFRSVDGGQTWEEHHAIDFIGAISDISFTPEGVGFATALSVFDDATILRYDPTGPPQTPVPVWNGNFTQIQCSDENCSVNCTTFTFPQYSCMGLNGGGSAIARCKDGILEELVYPMSANCTGLSEMQPMPVAQCIQQNGGGSFENFCGPVGSAFRGEKLMRGRR